MSVIKIVTPPEVQERLSQFFALDMEAKRDLENSIKLAHDLRAIGGGMAEAYANYIEAKVNRSREARG